MDCEDGLGVLNCVSPNPALRNIEWGELLRLQLKEEGREINSPAMLCRGEVQATSSWGLEKSCMGEETLSWIQVGGWSQVMGVTTTVGERPIEVF